MPVFAPYYSTYNNAHELMMILCHYLMYHIINQYNVASLATVRITKMFVVTDSLSHTAKL